MIDHGTRSGMVIPVHEPSANTALQNLQRSIALPDPDFARTLGINPSHALQHSGFYYYMAAKCTDMRRARFLAALEAEVRQLLLIVKAELCVYACATMQNNNTPIALSPGFANEKKVDHLSLILEVGMDEKIHAHSFSCISFDLSALYQSVRTLQEIHRCARVAPPIHWTPHSMDCLPYRRNPLRIREVRHGRPVCSFPCHPRR